MQYNSTPLPRILNGRDPVTGLKLVLFHKRLNRYIPNPHIPVCRSGEEHLVENYELAKNDTFKGWICHHRLELTLDGQFANSAIDLVNKDMYFHRPYYELIWIRSGEHSRLHYSGCKSSSWKGGIASDHKEYLRQYRAKKRALRDCALPLRSNSN